MKAAKARAAASKAESKAKKDALFVIEHSKVQWNKRKSHATKKLVKKWFMHGREVRKAPRKEFKFTHHATSRVVISAECKAS